MSKRNPITPEETVQTVPGLSTDATAAAPEEQRVSLHIRTCIRAGADVEWQSLLGSSEGAPGSV